MKKIILATILLSLILLTSLSPVTTSKNTESKGALYPTIGAIQVETYMDFPNGTAKKIKTRRICEGGIAISGSDLIIVIIPPGKIEKTITVTFKPTFPYIRQPTRTETYTVGQGIFGLFVENDYKYHQIHWWF